MNLGINGFGRIGRSAARIALFNPEIKNIHVNDLGDIQTLSHLLKYDSIHNKLPLKFSIKDETLLFENEKTIFFLVKRTQRRFHGWTQKRILYSSVQVSF